MTFGIDAKVFLFIYLLDSILSEGSSVKEREKKIHDIRRNVWSKDAWKYHH